MPELQPPVPHLVSLTHDELEALVHSLGRTLVERKPKWGGPAWERWKRMQSLYSKLGRMYLGSS